MGHRVLGKRLHVGRGGEQSSMIRAGVALNAELKAG